MSSKVAGTISSVYEEYSKVREFEERQLEGEIKPKLAALLKELLEEFVKIEDSTKKKLEDYELPGKRFSIGRIIKQHPEHYGNVLVYNPVSYVKETVKNIHDASILLDKIRELEEYVTFYPGREKVRITLVGKYFPDARRLYEGKLSTITVEKS